MKYNYQQRNNININNLRNWYNKLYMYLLILIKFRIYKKKKKKN